jgi:soluble lytic murein transglycosylase-like protein
LTPSSRHVAHAACAAAILLSLGLAAAPAQEAAALPTADFPFLPLPPAVESLVAFPQPYRMGRAAHLALVTREAEQQGLPVAIADAVAHVESAYNPNAVGGVGEVGLMQIRPTTAAMLGYRGAAAGLFEPETNVRYSVAYLAGAWRLTNGDLCRTLMKYRAGHGEERMTALSVEYCRRARSFLATIGSPLGSGAVPTADAVPFGPLAARRPTNLRVAALGAPKLSEAQASALVVARERDRTRKAKSRQLWAAHAARLQAIEAKLKPAQLRIAGGI